jgi:ubiquinone/menaquinone biosynthesis C-methylase UbiE
MNRAHDQYAIIAELYDLMAGDGSIQAFYDEWRASLLQAVRRYKVKVRVMVDLACGTGNTAIPWAGRGWTVVGVDSSAAMLREARKKSSRVRWYCQDLRNLDLKERADVATCHFDALNHIIAGQDMQRILVRVARILNPGGLFQFDMNTHDLFRWLAAHEKFFPVGRNYLMAQNTYDPRRRIATFYQFWFVRKGRLYEKREIKIQERAYSSAEIRRMLKRAGLQPLKAKIQRRVEGKPGRVLYLARKPRLRRIKGPAFDRLS